MAAIVLQRGTARGHVAELMLAGTNEVCVAVDPREAALKSDLTAQRDGPPFVSIERFFDGNHDEGSIGCNLTEHPGLDRFRELLVGLVGRADVQGVYAQIAEIDPGEGLWPFTDTIFIAGTIPADELGRLLAPLQPDEVGPANDVPIPPRIREKHATVLYAWWD